MEALRKNRDEWKEEAEKWKDKYYDLIYDLVVAGEKRHDDDKTKPDEDGTNQATERFGHARALEVCVQCPTCGCFGGHYNGCTEHTAPVTMQYHFRDWFFKNKTEVAMDTLQVGIKIKDNDPRRRNRVFTIYKLDGKYAYCHVGPDYPTVRILRSRIYTDGCKRKSGFSVVETSQYIHEATSGFVGEAQNDQPYGLLPGAIADSSIVGAGDHIKNAIDEGYIAFYKGRHWVINPYNMRETTELILWKSWVAGWELAQVEHFVNTACE